MKTAPIKTPLPLPITYGTVKVPAYLIDRAGQA